MKVVTRGPKIGRCNICGNYGPLTEDHTPPKGNIRVSQVEMRHIVEHLNAGAAVGKGRISQDGVKYRTLCSVCNNTRLGSEYDPAFIDFTGKVAALLNSSLALPPVIAVEGKPQRIIRSVLGHIAAQGLDRFDMGAIAKPMRNYFLNPGAKLPSSVSVYYWVYPFQKQVLIRDCALTDLTIKNHEPVSLWLMKFYPLAFMVTWDKPTNYAVDAPNLGDYRSLGIDDVVQIPIPLRPVKHEFWPEAPTTHSFLLYGDGAIGAIKRPPRKPRR